MGARDGGRGESHGGIGWGRGGVRAWDRGSGRGQGWGRAVQG